MGNQYHADSHGTQLDRRSFAPFNMGKNYEQLIYTLREHERYVYHYTTLTTARDYILKANHLRFGSFPKTNDPRESRQWQFQVGAIAPNKDLGPYALQDVSEWMSSTIQRKTRVACFCRDTGPLTGDHLRDIYKRGLARARMWAQYGDNHRGVCLVFDLAKLVGAMKRKVEAMGRTVPVLLVYAPVSYVNHDFFGKTHEHAFSVTVEDLEQVGRDNYPWHHAALWWQDLFFRKVEDWQDEAEWRAVALVDSDDPLDVDVREALAGVIHGDLVTRDESRTIFALTEDRPEVEHMGLTWKNGAPWYDIGGLWSYCDRHLPGLRDK